MAGSPAVTKPILKTYSLDGNFAFPNRKETKNGELDLEHYGIANKSIFKNLSKERITASVNKLEEERFERSKNLEEAWNRVKAEIGSGPDTVSIGLQTEDFVPREETFTKDGESQTDLFADDPLLNESLTNVSCTVDKETQLFSGELFDFEREVEPILQELVSPIIDEALLEVLEEEENQTTNVQRQRFWPKDKPYSGSAINMELRKSWNSFQETVNEELMISVLANDYVDDVLSMVHGTVSQEEASIAKQKNTDYVDSFLPWFVGKIDRELRKLQDAYDALTSHLQ